MCYHVQDHTQFVTLVSHVLLGQQKCYSWWQIYRSPPCRRLLSSRKAPPISQYATELLFEYDNLIKRSMQLSSWLVDSTIKTEQFLDSKCGQNIFPNLQFMIAQLQQVCQRIMYLFCYSISGTLRVFLVYLSMKEVGQGNNKQCLDTTFRICCMDHKQIVFFVMNLLLIFGTHYNIFLDKN